MGEMKKQLRYCDIKATSLEEVPSTCNRHIANIIKTKLDLFDNDDGTPTDDFYIDMFLGTWVDLRNDVSNILKNNNNFFQT